MFDVHHKRQPPASPVGADAPPQAGRNPLSCHRRGRMLQTVITEDDSTDATVTMPVTVRDLLPQDLPACTWSGSATHLRHVERELARAASGEVDYLAVCTPVDLPVAIGGIDYEVAEEAGTLWQLAVLPALQSCGLGTLLVRAAEQRAGGDDRRHDPRGGRVGTASYDVGGARARAALAPLPRRAAALPAPRPRLTATNPRGRGVRWV